jgi:hypothetical protein
MALSALRRRAFGETVPSETMGALDVLGLGVLGAAVAALASIVWTSLKLGISPMPTSPAVRKALLAVLPESVDGDVHEFGAGWGGLAFALAQKYSAARVVAWEASPVPYLVLRLRRALRRTPNLVALRRDFYEADLSCAGLVVCYLWTGAMGRLAEKFQRELAAGAVVVSHTFALRGWTAEVTARAGDLYRTPVYRYRVSHPVRAPLASAQLPPSRLGPGAP